MAENIAVVVLLLGRGFGSAPTQFPQPTGRIRVVERQGLVVRVLTKLNSDVDLTFAHQIMREAEIVEIGVLDHQVVDALWHRPQAKGDRVLPAIAVHERRGCRHSIGQRQLVLYRSHVS